MRISGSHQELKFLLRMATQMKGEYLYFGPEGDFWMIYDKGRIAYIKTKLDVSHDIVIGRSGFVNLHNTFFRIRKHEQLTEYEEYDWGMDYVRVDEESVQIGSDPKSKVWMDTTIERVPMFSPLAEKMRGMRTANEPSGIPYITMEWTLLKRYVSDMTTYFNQYKEGWTFNSGLLKQSDDETMNILTVDDNGELTIIRKPPANVEAPVTKFQYSTGWFVHERNYDYAFYLSDTDLRLMILTGKHESITEFRILLFKQHYVLDAHEADLRFKMWLHRDKSTVGQFML